MRRGQAHKSKTRTLCASKETGDETGSTVVVRDRHSHWPKMRTAFPLQMHWRETLTWGVGWPVFQKHPGLSLQEAPQGYPPPHPVLPPQPHRIQVVGVAGQARSPSSPHWLRVWRGKRRGGWKKMQDRTRADRARLPASVFWPSGTSEFWGWSFTRENEVITWIPVHFAPAFHDLHSSLFTRTLWGSF